ncbi:hypothetical protein [uncultured Helicobacter sp.]|uniref:hypothetical protein n=1 Tax=uncultured Helicobacter sp. TaxID=175537 RepID=UPI0037512322
MAIDSAIFAQQKSNQCVGAQAPTATRPCRGVKNALRKCSSAFLAFLTRQGDSEALPPKDILLAAEKSQRVASKAQQKQRRLFRGFRSGEGITPLFAKKQSDFENLGSIRENATQRNTESKAFTESSAEILKNEKNTESRGRRL